MAQMYKVFTEKGVFIFTDLRKNTETNVLVPSTYKVIEWSKKFDYKSLSGQKNYQVVYSCLQPKKSMLVFFKDHLVVHAAGGLVYNQHYEFLVIFRNGVWDLPKGKMEKGESKETTAVREVEEECGISDLKIERPLLTTYHTYKMKDKKILKPSHWYLMKYEGNETPQPQLEEGIHEIQWIDKETLISLKGKTYPSIADVIDTYIHGKV